MAEAVYGAASQASAVSPRRSPELVGLSSNLEFPRARQSGDPMIFDRLEYAKLYHGLSPGIARGFDYLRTTDLRQLPPGRVEIDGESMFAMVVDEPTRIRSDCKWESHRRYHDIQYVVDGEEVMGFASLDQMRVVEPFKESLDYAFYEGDGQYITVRPGFFALFAPQDVHRPSMAVTTPMRVRKVVIKIEV